jgi:hypothetical protein
MFAQQYSPAAIRPLHEKSSLICLSNVAKATKKRYEVVKPKLFAEVKNAFYEYTYLASAIEIAKENLELIQHFE